MNDIKIILSTALVDDNISVEDRMNEYKECFEIINSLGYSFSIVETVVKQSDFLEIYSNNVTYTNVNGKYKNRGTNYVNAFKKYLNNSNYNDNDIIIHITGRYPLVDDSFFINCLNLDIDKIGLFKKDIHNQFYLFLYAMRFKHLKDLLNSIDVDHMEKNMINLEIIFSNNIPHNDIKFVDYLGIFGRQSNENDPSKYGKIKF